MSSDIDWCLENCEQYSDGTMFHIKGCAFKPRVTRSYSSSYVESLQKDFLKLVEVAEVTDLYLKSREILEDQKEVDWDLFEQCQNKTRETLATLRERIEGLRE